MFYPGVKSYQALATVYVLLLFVLFGCGSDKEASSNVTPTATTIQALDSVAVVQPGILADIDLLNLVKANGRIGVKEVYAEQSRCPAPELSVRGFNVYPEAGVICDYSYIVEAGLLQSSARVTVLATRADNPILNPLSHPMVIASGNVAFNLNQLLGGGFPEGYTLQSVEMMPTQSGDGGPQGSATITSANVITYTPPNRIGFDGITYILQKDADPEFTVVGSIYVTISQKPNEAPVIGVPNLDYVSADFQPLIARTQYDINLATAGVNITVDEGKDYHLVHVKSSTATVSRGDNDNKTISFQAEIPGNHLVAYIVGDDFGGFSMGFIKVSVDAMLNPMTWRDLVVDGRTFTAPVLYNPELTNLFNVIPVWDDSVNNNAIPTTTIVDLGSYENEKATEFGNTIAAFRSYSSAQAYCGTRGGRLPSYDESLLIGGMSAGVDEFGLINNAPGWPKGRPYALDVNGAEPAGFPWEQGAYVSCIKHTAMDLDLNATEFERFARDTGVPLSNELGILTTESADDSIAYEVIGGSLMDGGNWLNITIVPMSNGSRLNRITANALRNGYAKVRFYNTTNPGNYIDTPMLRFSSIDFIDINNGVLISGSPSTHDQHILENQASTVIIAEYGNRLDPVPGFTYRVYLLDGGKKMCDLYNSVALYGRNNWLPSRAWEHEKLREYGDMEQLGWPVKQYYKSADRASCAANYYKLLYIDHRGSNGCGIAQTHYSYVSCYSRPTL